MKNKAIILLIILSNFFFINAGNTLTFAKMEEDVKRLGKMKKIAVAGGDNLTSLQSCRKAKDLKIADCILIGDAKKTQELAKSSNVDISDFELVNEVKKELIGLIAAKLIHDGEADIFAKGSLDSTACLKGIFDHKRGLKKDRLVTGISLFELSDLNKLIIFTDPHVVTYPTIIEKVSLINNAVEFAHAMGIEVPKVAAVTAYDEIMPEVRETTDAERLVKMNEMGQIRDCVVDGPIGLATAINPAVQITRLTNEKVKGDADIVLFPDINAANIAFNLMIHGIEAKSATLLSGTTNPVVFTARGSSAEDKFNSIILAIYHFEYLKQQKINNLH